MMHFDTNLLSIQTLGKGHTAFNLVFQLNMSSIEMKTGRSEKLTILSIYMYNTELNDLRKVICLRKCAVFVERISVCYAIEKLMGHTPIPMAS